MTEHGFLHFATKNDDADLLTWALAKGADPNVKDKKGKKPIELLPKKDHKLKGQLKSGTRYRKFQLAYKHRSRLQLWLKLSFRKLE